MYDVCQRNPYAYYPQYRIWCPHGRNSHHNLTAMTIPEMKEVTAIFTFIENGVMIPPMAILTGYLFLSDRAVSHFKKHAYYYIMLVNTRFMLTGANTIIDYVDLKCDGCLSEDWLLANEIILVASYCAMIFKTLAAIIMQLNFQEKNVSRIFMKIVVFLIAVLLSITWVLSNTMQFEKEYQHIVTNFDLLIPNSMIILSLLATLCSFYELKKETMTKTIERFMEYGYFQLVQDTGNTLMALMLVSIKVFEDQEMLFLYGLRFVLSLLYNCWSLLELYSIYHALIPNRVNIGPMPINMAQVIRSHQYHESQSQPVRQEPAPIDP